MSAGLIALVGVIYAYVGVEQFLKGNLGIAICYIAYAVAQVGWYILAVK
jgi:hypothetical protein